jgi:fumarate reductase subunit D
VIDALRFEWVRIRTLRSTYWLIGLAVLLSAVVALTIALATRTDPARLGAVTVGNILTGGGSFAIPLMPIFVAIIGVMAPITSIGWHHPADADGHPATLDAAHRQDHPDRTRGDLRHRPLGRHQLCNRGVVLDRGAQPG